MRHWQYIQPGEGPDGLNNPEIIVMSDQEIVDIYWEWWYDKMCQKYGQKRVDENYCKLDCIDDYVVVHWATEVKD